MGKQTNKQTRAKENIAAPAHVTRKKKVEEKKKRNRNYHHHLGKNPFAQYP